MRSYPKYDKSRDIASVDQFGFIDLVDSFAKGYVSGDSDVKAEMFNDIDEPSAIAGKPTDVFEAMRMQDAIIDNARSRSGSRSGSSSSRGSSSPPAADPAAPQRVSVTSAEATPSPSGDE